MITLIQLIGEQEQEQKQKQKQKQDYSSETIFKEEYKRWTRVIYHF